MLELFLAGGWVMWPILLCSGLAVGIIIERFWSLRRKEVLPLTLGQEVRDWARHARTVAKHFELTITDTTLTFARKAECIANEAALDGLYIVRTSVPADQMSAPDCVRNYKALANVERAFRSLKTIDLKVRPIHHRLADRVRAHIFLCMLAYYVEWHMKEAWRPLLFADTDTDAKATRDPVAPAQRSSAAQRKVASRTLDDGTPAHSFATLIADLATIVRNTCHAPNDTRSEATFQITTTANSQQQRALDLVQAIHL